jgi:hypothetical protein
MLRREARKKLFRNVRYFTFAVPPKIHSLTAALACNRARRVQLGVPDAARQRLPEERIMRKKFEQYRKTLKRRHIYGHPLVWWQRLIMWRG